MIRAVVFIAVFAFGVMMVGAVERLNMLGALGAINFELTRFSEASTALIARTFSPPKPESDPVDPVTAANVDEDLDFRIAAGKKTEAEWLTFLDRHPNGVHASEAHAELDRMSNFKGPPPASSPPASSASTAPPPFAPFSPVVEIENAPPQREPDWFAALERQQPPLIVERTRKVQTTVIKWRKAKTRYETRYVTRWERPRYGYGRGHEPYEPPLFFGLFGQRDRTARRIR